MLKYLCVGWGCLCAAVRPALCQMTEPEALSGADRHELSPDRRGHLLGDWDEARGRLEEMGVQFDVQYFSDTLWNIKSKQPSRAAIWNRIRATVDIDFGTLLLSKRLVRPHHRSLAGRRKSGRGSWFDRQRYVTLLMLQF